MTYHFLGTMTNGGPQQICGGLSFISIYNNTDPSFVANGSNKNSAGNVPQDLPVVTKPNYVGCATDNYNNTGRTLTGASLSQLNMSSSICQNFCATAQGGRGWQYWGTEYETHQHSHPLFSPSVGHVLTNPSLYTDTAPNATAATPSPAPTSSPRPPPASPTPPATNAARASATKSAVAPMPFLCTIIPHTLRRA